MSTYPYLVFPLLFCSCLGDFAEKNFPPSITLERPTNETTFNETDEVKISALLSDGEDQPASLLVRLQSSKSGLLLEAYPDSTGQLEASYADLEPGEHTLTLTVEDSGGLFTSESVVIQINSLPNQPEILLTPDNPTTEDDLQVQIIEADDNDNDSVSLSFRWYKDGILQEDQTTSSVPSSATSKDELWRVKVFSSDGQGNSPEADASVQIGDTPPTIDSITITPSSEVTTSSILTCEATTSDIDNDTLTINYRWALLSNGYYSDLEIFGPEISLDPSIAQPTDKIYCAVRVRDENDITVEDAFYLNIDNTPPTLNAHAILPSTGVIPGKTLSCYASFADPDQSTLDPTLLWYRNGDLIALGQNLELTQENAAKGDTITCQLALQDEHGGTLSSEVSVQVENTPPVMNSVGITPTPAYANGALECTAEASDIDSGDSIEYAYVWKVNGILQAETTSSVELARVVGDSIECQITPFDGESYGAPMSSTVTIQNEPPIISSLSFNSSEIYTNDVISASVSASDPDNDMFSLEFRWYVDGNLVQNSIQNSLNGAETTSLVGLNASNTKFDKNQVVTLVVFASDEYGTGDSLTDSITILNSPPSIETLTPSLEEIYTDSEVVVTVTGSDVDNDTVFFDYEWFVDGQLVPPDGEFLPPDQFTKGQEIEVRIRPNDGAVAGSAVFWGGMVRNSPPEVPPVELMPENPVPSSIPLRCHVQGQIYDVDGDNVNTTIEWFVNQHPYNGPTMDIQYTGDAIPGSLLEEGAEWACLVRVSDGDSMETSEIVTTTVTCDYEYGSIEQCPAESCLELINFDASLSDGVYWLDPDGNGPFEAFCDMSHDGGGWTLIMLLDSDSTTFDYDSLYWIDESLYNESYLTPNDSATGEDAKFESFNRVAGEDLRLDFVVPEHNLYFDQMYGQTALQLFQGSSVVIASDTDNDGCNSTIELQSEFDANVMQLPIGTEFFGLNGEVNDGLRWDDKIRFGMLAYDGHPSDSEAYATAVIGIGITLREYGPNHLGPQNNHAISMSTAWGENLVNVADLCSNACGICAGSGTSYTKTSSNLWVR